MVSSVLQFFLKKKNLYKDTTSNGDPSMILEAILTKVTDSDNAILMALFKLEEFKIALSQMDPDKASGPYGFNLAFFQTFFPKILGSHWFAGISTMFSMDT